MTQVSIKIAYTSLSKVLVKERAQRLQRVLIHTLPQQATVQFLKFLRGRLDRRVHETRSGDASRLNETRSCDVLRLRATSTWFAAHVTPVNSLQTIYNAHLSLNMPQQPINLDAIRSNFYVPRHQAPAVELSANRNPISCTCFWPTTSVLLSAGTIDFD